MANSRGTPAGARNRAMPNSRTPIPPTLIGSNVNSETIGVATP